MADPTASIAHRTELVAAHSSASNAYLTIRGAPPAPSLTTPPDTPRNSPEPERAVALPPVGNASAAAADASMGAALLARVKKSWQKIVDARLTEINPAEFPRAPEYEELVVRDACEYMLIHSSRKEARSAEMARSHSLFKRLVPKKR